MINELEILSNEHRIFLLFPIMLVFLLPANVFAESHDSWDADTVIDVSIVGDSVVNLDSSNTLLRAYVDITNYDPSDGYYYMRIIQSSTDEIISEENIVIREKSNGEAGADVAHLVTEDEIAHTGAWQGNYDILVYTEFGTAIGNATFSIIKPSDPNTLVQTEIESEEESSEIDESLENDSTENESELINAKKIPDWVKNIFVLYSYDEISESELLNALKYLIEQGILEIN